MSHYDDSQQQAQDEGGRAIVLYLHVHQPYRIRQYSVFETGRDHNYFDAADGDRTNNADIIRKVAFKSYIPTNERLLRMLHENPEFKLSMSITGTVLEQFERYAPEVLESFKQVIATGRVEIVAETYHHSLAFFYSRQEFEAQVNMHRDKVQQLFGVTPTAFRNTELSYNNDIAYWADKAGYKAILSEGWDPVLGWRSPNFVYRPSYTENIKLLCKNYKMSDDIAFRFSNKGWEEYPLTVDKYIDWLNTSWQQPLINLFMDYETFGEHQWADTGIFEFLEELPKRWLTNKHHTFMTVTEAAENFEAVDYIDTPNTITWADTERDLTAWLGNAMQQNAIAALYELEKPVLNCNDEELLADWRKLPTSDHFFYMCTKWWSDGDVHAYFSPYETPYIAAMNFMNAYHDVKFRLAEHGEDTL